MSSSVNGIVIHVTSGDVDEWTQALRNMSNLYQDESTPTPPDMITVVVNGSAVRFLRASSIKSEQLTQMIDAGVRIRACETSLDRFGQSSDDLVEGISTVPSGVAEVVRLQWHNHGYLKLP